MKLGIVRGQSFPENVSNHYQNPTKNVEIVLDNATVGGKYSVKYIVTSKC